MVTINVTTAALDDVEIFPLPFIPFIVSPELVLKQLDSESFHAQGGLFEHAGIPRQLEQSVPPHWYRVLKQLLEEPFHVQ